jgi:hypothetical protein
MVDCEHRSRPDGSRSSASFHRIGVQARRVVAVGVAGGDHQQPEANDVGNRGTAPPGSRGSSMQAARRSATFQSLLDLAQNQQSTVGRQPATVKAGDNLFALDR